MIREQVEHLLYALRRQFPCPSAITTCSPCVGEVCAISTRGGGYCRYCLKNMLAEEIGKGLAQRYFDCLLEQHNVLCDIEDIINEEEEKNV